MDFDDDGPIASSAGIRIVWARGMAFVANGGEPLVLVFILHRNDRVRGAVEGELPVLDPTTAWP